jgi:hypothetical protein
LFEVRCEDELPFPKYFLSLGDAKIVGSEIEFPLEAESIIAKTIADQ